MEKNIIVIPDDVIEEILLRLPVKDLLRWKCVSKRWYVLIWDDDFVKKHYRFHYAMRLASHGDKPLLLNYPTGQFHLLSKQGERDVVLTRLPDFGIDSRVPQRRVRWLGGVVNALNGIVGLLLNGFPNHFSTDSPVPEGIVFCYGVVNGIVLLSYFRFLALLNPATREFKDVPLFLVDDKYRYRFDPVLISLGFDIQSKDFKILGGIRSVKYDINSYVLYSMRANSWKRVKDTPRTYTNCNLLESTDAYYDNGVWYCVANVGDFSRPDGIVAFNFSSEIFKEVELPSLITQFENDKLRVGKYKEGIAIFGTPRLDREDTCIKIWAATRFRDDDDYELPSSWELVVKIQPINLFRKFFTKAIFDCGDLLLDITTFKNDDEEGGDGYSAEPGTYVYHPSTRTFKYLAPRFWTSYRYMESLFPLSRRHNFINTTS